MKTSQEGIFRSAKFAVHSMSRDHEWQTPQALFDSLNSEFRFTIDLAADETNKLCDRFYSEQNDALEKDWSGERAFCNPPYARRLKDKFIIKAAAQASLNPKTVVVLLLPARTDTRIFHEVILPFAKEIRFLQGRICFNKSDSRKGYNAAPFPSMIVVFK